MKRFRTIGAIIAATVLVLAGGVLALRLLVSPNQFKPLLVKAAREALGLDLVIEGDLTLALFPRLAVTAGRTTLKNPPGFPGDLASFKSLRLEASLGKLLEKRLDINTLVLASPVFALVRSSDGKTNWEALLAPGAGPQAPPGQAAPSDLQALAIQALSLTDATLTYDDRQTGQNLTIAGASLQTGAVRLGEPVRLDGGLNFTASAPEAHGRLDFVAELNFTPQGPRVNLSGIAVKSKVFHPALPSGGLELTLTGQADYDAAASKAVWEIALAEAGGSILSSKGTVSLNPAGPTVEADCILAGINPRALAARFGRPLPATRDPGALTRLEGELNIAHSPDKTTLASPRLLLDKTILTLDLALKGNDPFELSGRAGAGTLNLDDYAPSGQDAARPPGAAKPEDTVPASPLAALAALPQARLTASVGRLAAAGLTLTDVSVTAEAKDGALRLAPATATLYGGKIRAEAKVEAKNNAPAVSLRCDGAQINLETLTRDLEGQAKLTGTAAFSADLTATGMAPKEQLASLGGTAKFNLRQGALLGVNITPESLNTPATLHLALQTHPQAQTRYDSVSASFRIERGQARTSDINVSAPPNSATGAGTIDLPQRRLDLAIIAHALNLAAIPLKITGPMEHPDVALDAAAALVGAAGALIKSPEKAGKSALDMLEGLGGLIAPKKK